MSRITKRVRDEAILICAIQASTPDVAGSTHTTAELLGLPMSTASIAYRAWDEATGHAALGDAGTDTQAEEYALAECLLRDGWSPS